MPGLVGFIGTRRDAGDAQTLRRMQTSIAHQSFYRSGQFRDETLGLNVAWTTRSGGFDDGMPLWDESRNRGLLFCGEEYPTAQARAALGAGVDTGRANYLLPLLDKLGDGFLDSLNGWFAGLIIDVPARRVTLFNDRFGLARLYVHEEADRIWFASEAKALLAVLPELRRLDPASLGEYLTCGCALENRTLFGGVRQLPGATRWEFEAGRPAPARRYFDQTTWTQQEKLGQQEYYAALRDTFARILPKYVEADGPTGVSLTGGVDSRMVMAWARAPRDRLRTYTFGGMYRDCTDVSIARRVAAISGHPHQVLEVGREFQRQFAELAEQTVFLTDGAMDVSGTPDLFVNRIARDISPIRLTGNYGGEILRRIVAFKPMPLRSAAFDGAVRDSMGAARATYARQLDADRLAFVAFKQVPWHHHSRLALERSQLTVRSPYLDNELVSLAFRAPDGAALETALALRLIADGNPALAELGTDRGLLRKGVPLVTPLVHGYQEFMFRAEYAYDYGMPDWLTRLDGRLRPLHLERLFLGRHKFYHFRYWYRDALAPYLRSVLLDERSLSRAHVDRRALVALVEAHTTARANHTLELHRLLSLELMHRTLLDAPGSSHE
jgi:asparagine synthase (glutamine-hydrolysing)